MCSCTRASKSQKIWNQVASHAHQKKFHILSAREHKVEDQKITHHHTLHDIEIIFTAGATHHLVFSLMFSHIQFSKFSQGFSVQLKTCSRPHFIEPSRYISFSCYFKSFLFSFLFGIFYCESTQDPELLKWSKFLQIDLIMSEVQDVKILFPKCSYYQIFCAEHEVQTKILLPFSCRGLIILNKL